jgi:hypothetical protein
MIDLVVGLVTAGVVLGIRCHVSGWYYLESTCKGDVLCDEWPRCWRRATHYHRESTSEAVHG